MRARLSDRRGSGVRLLACSAAALLMALLVSSCSGGDPAQVEASQASPEPTVEPQATAEPTEEPSEPEPEPEPTIGDDEPLYAPLPELTPDPHNDIPDDLEQLILDAFAEAYATEHELYAAGELDNELLERTHFGDGYFAVEAAVDYLRGEGGRELSPDASVTDVFVVDFQGGSAIVRECIRSGQRTGLYDRDSGSLLRAVDWEVLARDRMMELTTTPQDSHPRYRATQVGFAPTDECS